jgi:hypothetical protein
VERNKKMNRIDKFLLWLFIGIGHRFWDQVSIVKSKSGDRVISIRFFVVEEV